MLQRHKVKVTQLHQGPKFVVCHENDGVIGFEFVSVDAHRISAQSGDEVEKYEEGAGSENGLIQTLPIRNEVFCQDLSSDQAKCFQLKSPLEAALFSKESCYRHKHHIPFEPSR